MSNTPSRPRLLRASSLGLLAGLSLCAAVAIANSDPTPPPANNAVCTLDSMDFVHKKIDIGAQYSLMRKMAGDRESQLEATSIFMAIEDGRLAGIYLPPRKPVSDRGRRMKPQRGYWDMIPKGKDSVCLKKPAGEPPMIIYREKLSKARVDAALTAAWADCGLANVPEPCDYTVIHKPPPQVECNTDQDCIDKNKGDFCNTQLHVCGVNFPDDELIGPSCVYPRCDASISTTVYAVCGKQNNVPIRCNPVPGDKCGVCDGVSNKSKTCHEANEKRHKAANLKCRKDYKPAKVAKYSASCVKAMVKCEGGSLTGCAEAAKCMIDPKPYKEYRKCLNKESARWFKESARCKKL